MNNLFLNQTSSFSKRILCGLTAVCFLGTSIFPNASIAQSLPSTILNLPRKDFFIEQMDARIVLAKRAISAATADAATLSVDNDTKGGIDLNPTILSTEIKRNGRGVIIPAFKGAGPDLDGMKGFVPNIINVTPITNLQLLLGLDIKSNENPQDPKNEKPVDVSFNLSALPAKEREEANFVVNYYSIFIE